MSISELLAEDTLKQCWIEFVDASSKYDSALDNLSGKITTIESNELFITTASEEEKALVTNYKAKVEANV